MEHRTANPLVSVIVPVYNKEASIARCLDSILGQTLSDIEVICVDDCSTDGSAAALERIAKNDARVKVIRQPENAGAGAARNTGLDDANGEYVTFVDSDDTIEHDMLEQLYVKCKATSAQIGLCGIALEYPSENRKEESSVSLDMSLLRDGHGDPFTIEDAGANAFLFVSASSCAKLYERSYLDRLGLRFTEHRVAEDLLFAYTALSHANRITAVESFPYLYDQETGAGASVASENVGVLLDVFAVMKTRLDEAGLLEKYSDGFVNLMLGHIGNMMNAALVDGTLDETFAAIGKWRSTIGEELFDGDKIDFANERQADICRFIRNCNPDEFVADRIKISVIVPVYNKGAKLEKCLMSILTQTMTDIEVICVDDCSPDNSAAVLADFAACDSRVRVITHDRNKGVGAARNTGIDAARGVYLSFIDADDTIDSTMFEKTWSKGSETNADMVMYGEALEYPSRNEVVPYERAIDTAMIPEGLQQPFKAADMGCNAFEFFSPSACSKLFRRELVNELGLRFTDHRIAEDVLFTCTFAANAQRMAYVKEYMYIYDQESGSGTTATWQSIPVILDVMDIFAGRLKDAGLYSQYEDAFENLAMSHLEQRIYNAQTEDELIETFKMFPDFAAKHMTKAPEEIEFSNDRFANYYACIRKADPLAFAVYRFQTLQKTVVEERGRAEVAERALIEATSRAQSAEEDASALRESNSYRVGNILMRAPSKIKEALKGKDRS